MKILLDLLAGVALLVWGTHFVRTGILRQYGSILRKLLRRSMSSRWKAFASGLSVTALLQSSTATALIVAAFAGQGLIATAPALAVMLGADVGTSIVTLVLSFDLDFLAPVLVVVGVTLFLRRQASAAGRFGRILIGLGLILFALQWIRTAAHPVVDTVGVKVLFASLTGDVMLDVLVGALITVTVYSSLAVVLLVATFASLSLVGPEVALGIVLGANLGNGLLGVMSTLHAEVEARRVTLGNFLFKLIGVVLAMPLVGYATTFVERAQVSPAHEVVLFHMAFNAVLAIVFIGLTERIAGFTERLMPAPPPAEGAARARHLDPSALETPALAIGNAARETLRIADVIDEMLRGMLKVLQSNDRDLAEQLRKRADVVDELYTAVKLYLTQVPRGALDERESRRWTDIVSFTINLEQVGDIIERILADIEDRKIDKGRSFSDAGMLEITDLHGRLVSNLRLATSVFLHGDQKSAQELLAQKVIVRDLERAYANSHLARLAGNTIESIETSSLHLDLISDMRRINSHFCSVAYPILEEAGVLARTRLMTPADNGIAVIADADEDAGKGEVLKDAPRGV
jgi:phosphate:Na+ symporter